MKMSVSIADAGAICVDQADAVRLLEHSGQVDLRLLTAQ
jgi:hypothetical protein